MNQWEEIHLRIKANSIYQAILEIHNYTRSEYGLMFVIRPTDPPKRLCETEPNIWETTLQIRKCDCLKEMVDNNEKLSEKYENEISKEKT